MLTTTKVVIGDMMRELVYYVAVSIDGYIAAPDGSYDAFPVEGDHMAVYLSDFADALPAHVLAALDMHPPGNRFDTVIQGRASYDIAQRPPSVELFTEYLRDIVHRLTDNRDAAIALFELRLEATRRPRVAEALTTWRRAGLQADIEFNEKMGLPGRPADITLFTTPSTDCFLIISPFPWMKLSTLMRW